MVGKGSTALGRVVMNKRERVLALAPHGNGLIGTTLHYADEVRKSDDYFGDIPNVKIAPDMLKLAQHIVDQKMPATFSRTCSWITMSKPSSRSSRRSRRTIRCAKAQNGDNTKNVINLMDALRRSVQSEKATAKSPKPAKGKKRVPGQGEMLLPIAGKKSKDEAKVVAKVPARRKVG